MGSRNRPHQLACGLHAGIRGCIGHRVSRALQGADQNLLIHRILQDHRADVLPVDLNAVHIGHLVNQLLHTVLPLDRHFWRRPDIQL